MSTITVARSAPGFKPSHSPKVVAVQITATPARITEAELKSRWYALACFYAGRFM